MSIRLSHRQCGLSLVEIMVAMVLGLILIGGVMQVFLGSKNTYRANEALSRLQEDGRFGLELLTRDVRMSGYAGCTRYGPITNTLKNQTSVAYDFSVGIVGYNDVSGTLPAALASLARSPRIGSDILVVRRDAGDPVRVVQNNNGAQVFVEVTGNESGACPDGSNKISGLCEGDILMVSDCTKSRIFQTGNLTTTGGNTLNVTHPSSGTPGNDPSSWGGSSAPDEQVFRDDATLVKVATYIYFVADDNNGMPTLYRQDGATAIEIAKGVEDLQVLYGIDTSPTDTIQSANTYVDADNVPNWQNVVSVRLNLLLRTQDNNITEAPQTYRFADTDITVTDASDRYVRKEFTALVALRNRLR